MTRPTILIRVPAIDNAALPASRAAIRAMAGQIAQLAEDHSGTDLADILLDLQGLAAQMEGHVRDMERQPDADGGRAFLGRAAAHLSDIAERLRVDLRRAGFGVAAGEDR